MHPLLELAKNLHRSEEGIWLAGASVPSAFGERGHDGLLEIEAGSFWFRHRNRCVTEVVRAHPPAGAILDVGAGNGYVTLALREAGFDALAVEPGIGGARNAQKRGLDPVICATIEGAGFPEGSLPAVGLFDVVEHICDDAGFLRTIRRLLRPDGMLYVSVPAYQWLWSIEDVLAGHYRRYTLRGIAALLERSGYSTVFASYFFTVLPLPIFLLRSVPSRVGLRKAPSLELATAEHRPREGAAGRLMERVLDWEVRRIRRGRRIAAGGSCLVAARTA
ncbi:MAG: class I SAM-dependent methyltransferase [Bryobacteraceae bacterium]|jgi:SAM-dependent methyltransferase